MKIEDWIIIHLEIELGDGQLCETHKAKWMWEIDKTNRVAASRARRNAATLANCQARDFVGAAVKADVRWSRLISEITALLMTAITVSLAIFFVFTPNLVSITVAGFWKRKKILRDARQICLISSSIHLEGDLAIAHELFWCFESWRLMYAREFSTNYFLPGLIRSAMQMTCLRARSTATSVKSDVVRGQKASLSRHADRIMRRVPSDTTRPQC